MRSTSYEVGARGLLAGAEGMGGRLAYDFAMYWIDVTNDIVPWNDGAFFYTAGKSRRKGAELGLDWTPVGPLTLSGAVSASNNEYIHYNNNFGTFDGNDVAGLPVAFFDGTARYRALPGFTVAGRVRQVGRYFADDQNTQSANAYSIVGLEADYTRMTRFGALRAFVAGDNITDKEYVSSVFINGTSNQFFEPGLPSNVSAGVTISFH